METMQECRQYLNGGPAQVQIEPWRHAQVKIKPWIPVISEDQAKGAQMIGHPVAAISQEVIVDDKPDIQRSVLTAGSVFQDPKSKVFSYSFPPTSLYLMFCFPLILWIMCLDKEVKIISNF